MGNKIVDHQDEVGAAIWYLASMNWAKTITRRDEKRKVLGFGATYIRDLTVSFVAEKRIPSLWDYKSVCQFSKMIETIKRRSKRQEHRAPDKINIPNTY